MMPAPVVYFAAVVVVYCYKFQHHRRMWRSHPCLLDYCYLINLLLALMWCGLLPTSLHTAVFVSVNGPMLSAVAIYSIPLKLLDKIHMTNWCACRIPIPGLCWGEGDGLGLSRSGARAGSSMFRRPSSPSPVTRQPRCRRRTSRLALRGPVQ